jgi:Putative zinc-finger
MNERCPDLIQLAELLDREATENDAVVLRAHLESCSSCAAAYASLEAMRRELAGPVVDVDVERLARQVEAAMAAPPRRRRLALWGLAAAAALFGVVTSLVSWPRGEAEFASRGGPVATGARRDVALSLFERRGGELLLPLPLVSGANLRADTLFAMSWTTKGANMAHHGVVVAIDAAREVHWMYPAFVNAAEVPRPFELPPRRDETLMDTVVRLDAPAVGSLTVIALLDPSGPDVVSRIEASKPEERTAEGLRALVRAGDVRSWQFTIEDREDAH